MDTWYLASLLTHLNWLEFLEIFLDFSSLQQFQVEYSWIKVAKVIAGHHRIPLKVKPHLFTSCFNRTNNRVWWSLIIEVEEKPDCSSVSMVWWHEYRNYRVFLKQSPWMYWPKKLFILTSWGTDKKLMFKEGCWLTSSNLLPNYLYCEISK